MRPQILSSAPIRSRSVFWLSAGFIRLVFQFVLFAVMLNLLLSSKADPLQKAVRVLPIAQSAQDDIAAALSGALRGVFESAAKLAAFHGIFTWLTFRMAGLPLVYLASVSSAACALLPLIQAWMIAIPAAVWLILQVRCLTGLHRVAMCPLSLCTLYALLGSPCPCPAAQDCAAGAGADLSWHCVAWYSSGSIHASR